MEQAGSFNRCYATSTPTFFVRTVGGIFTKNEVNEGKNSLVGLFLLMMCSNVRFVFDLEISFHSS